MRVNKIRFMTFIWRKKMRALIMINACSQISKKHSENRYDWVGYAIHYKLYKPNLIINVNGECTKNNLSD